MVSHFLFATCKAAGRIIWEIYWRQPANVGGRFLDVPEPINWNAKKKTERKKIAVAGLDPNNEAMTN